jgi:Tfp pilus assembly protein PilX
MMARLAGRRGKDAGIAIVATIGSFTIVMIVALGSLAFVSNSTKYSRFEQDVDLALAAAEAGIADLLRFSHQG